MAQPTLQFTAITRERSKGSSLSHDMFFRQSGGDSVCLYSVLVTRSLGDSFDHSLLY